MFCETLGFGFTNHEAHWRGVLNLGSVKSKTSQKPVSLASSSRRQWEGSGFEELLNLGTLLIAYDRLSLCFTVVRV